jgi:NADH dehydrogenase [ubiquinone] 1 alpha subcomplex assembly factor 7
MSTTLKQIIMRQIAMMGPLDLGSYMTMVLGHPQYGYYNTRDPFGVHGDFTTAPEISQMFGELIGAWVVEMWVQLGTPENFILLECGPGRGTLMADALYSTRRVARFHESANITLMEMSTVLRAKQHAALSDYDVTWVESLNDDIFKTNDMPIICIANEFIDALPVRQFEKIGALWHERLIGVENDNLVIRLSPPVEAPSDATEDGIYEIAPARNNFVRDLSGLIAKCGGAALIIDYGYERSQMGDTMQAVKSHKYVGILDHIGDADITAHVDFQAIAQAASERCRVFGPVSQGVFLKSMGIEVRASILKRAGDEKLIDDALLRLTDPDQMGQLFKLISFVSPISLKPAGF